MEHQERDLQDERRESGMPGGGQGRRDEIGGDTHVYSVSDSDLAPEDVLIRTPGQLGQRGRGLEGYYDHGEGGVNIAPDGGTQTETNPGVKSSSGPSSTGGVAGRDADVGSTAADFTVDVDQDNTGPVERY